MAEGLEEEEQKGLFLGPSQPVTCFLWPFMFFYFSSLKEKINSLYDKLSNLAAAYNVASYCAALLIKTNNII